MNFLQKNIEYMVNVFKLVYLFVIFCFLFLQMPIDVREFVAVLYAPCFNFVCFVILLFLKRTKNIIRKLVFYLFTKDGSTSPRIIFSIDT